LSTFSLKNVNFCKKRYKNSVDDKDLYTKILFIEGFPKSAFKSKLIANFSNSSGVYPIEYKYKRILPPDTPNNFFTYFNLF